MVGTVLAVFWLAVQEQVNIVGQAAMQMLHDDWSSSELQQQISETALTGKSNLTILPHSLHAHM